MKKYLMSLIVIVVIAAVAISVLLGKIEELETRNAALLAEIADARTQLETLQAERDTLDTQLTALLSEHATLEMQYATVSAEKEQLETDYAALITAHDTLNADYAVAQAELTQLRGYKTQAEELAIALEDITAKHDALVLENTEITAQLDAANQKIMALDLEITQLKGRIAIIKQMLNKE